MVTVKRAQAAMEFLLNYGWALLVLLLVIGVLAYMGVLSPSKFVPDTCAFSFPFKCSSVAVGSDGVIVALSNAGPRDILVKSIEVKSDVLQNPCPSGIALPGVPIASGETKTLALDCGTNAQGTKNKYEATVTYTYQDADITQVATAQFTTTAQQESSAEEMCDEASQCNAFGNITIGGDGILVTVTNQGSSALTVNSITVAGLPEACNPSIPGGANIESGETRLVRLDCSTASAGAEGAYSATIDYTLAGSMIPATDRISFAAGSQPDTSVSQACSQSEEGCQQTISSSVVGLWTFDEINGRSVADLSSYANTGTFRDGSAEQWNDGTFTPVGGVTSTEGQFGNALAFDGVQDHYVDAGTASSLNFGTGEFTAEAWVYANDLTTNWQTVVSRVATATPWNGWWLGIPDTDGQIAVYIEGGVKAQAPLPLNTWTHVAVTRSGGTVRLYVNGNTPVTGSIMGSYNVNVAPTPPLRLGDVTGWGTGSFKGTVDEVRLYARALSQAEIQANMNSHYPVCCTQASWSFESLTAAGKTPDTRHIVRGAKGDGAFYFDGTNDRVHIPNDPAFNFGATTDFTVSAWVTPHSTTATGSVNNFVFKGSGSGNVEGYYLALRRNDRRVSSLIADNTNHAVGNEQFLTGNALNLNERYHVAMAADRDGTAQLYLNGVPQASPAPSISAIGDINHNAALTFGSLSLTTARNDWMLRGTLDEVKIWNKALSATEIQTEYNARK